MTFRVRHYGVIATKPVHRLQIHPSNNAQLEGTPYHSSKLRLGECSSVEMWRETDRHTDTHTETDTQTDGHGHCTFHVIDDSREM